MSKAVISSTPTGLRINHIAKRKKKKLFDWWLDQDFQNNHTHTHTLQSASYHLFRPAVYRARGVVLGDRARRTSGATLQHVIRTNRERLMMEINKRLISSRRC